MNLAVTALAFPRCRLRGAMSPRFRAGFPTLPQPKQVALQPDHESSPMPPGSKRPLEAVPWQGKRRTGDKNRFDAPMIFAADGCLSSGRTRIQRPTSPPPRVPDCNEGNIDCPTFNSRCRAQPAHPWTAMPGVQLHLLSRMRAPPHKYAERFRRLRRPIERRQNYDMNQVLI